MPSKFTDISDIFQVAKDLNVGASTFSKLIDLISAAHNLGINEATQGAIAEVERSADFIKIQLRK